MSIRRPRVKASANLMTSKRKPKSQVAEVEGLNTKSDVKSDKDILNAKESSTSKHQQEITADIQQSCNETIQSKSLIPTSSQDNLTTINDSKESTRNCSQSSQILNSAVDEDLIEDIVAQKNIKNNSVLYEALTVTNNSNLEPSRDSISKLELASAVDLPITKSKQNLISKNEESFKCPQNLDYNRSTSVLEDVFSSDIEENIIQIDLQKSISDFPMSPTKSRQRIRATPIFGQRRNSFVGSSPSPHSEDDHTSRRERHSSTSFSTYNMSYNNNSLYAHKYLPSNGVGRIRTVSGCSTISDSQSRDLGTKARKTAFEDQRAFTRKDFQLRFNGSVPDKSMLKMFDLIYYNPVSNPMEQKPITPEVALNKDKVENTSEVSSPSCPEQKNAPVPQLKLGTNGEMMIDEQSLVIETTAEKEARKVLANSSLIYLDENTGNNGFYKRQKRTKEWPPEETVKFYRCLQTIGTDFSLMLTLFPNRSRRDLKLKFKKEERCNSNLINKALLYPKTFNIDELQVQLENDEKQRQEEEKRWKEIKAKDAKNIKKAAMAISSAERIISSGDFVYQNENVTKEKLSKRAKRTDQSLQKKPKKIKTEAPNVIKSEPNRIDNAVKNNVDIDDVELERDLINILQGDGNEGDTMDTTSMNSVYSNNILNNQFEVNLSDETDISQILKDLSDGSLVFISSINPTNSDEILNEIFRINQTTGLLYDKPLDLPEDVVQCIMSVMS